MLVAHDELGVGERACSASAALAALVFAQGAVVDEDAEEDLLREEVACDCPREAASKVRRLSVASGSLSARGEP